jgi:hypothetical protein
MVMRSHKRNHPQQYDQHRKNGQKSDENGLTAPLPHFPLFAFAFHLLFLLLNHIR